MTEAAPKGPLATPDAWDLVSGGYVTEIVPTFTRYAEDALRITGLRPGERVVDVACGPGTLSFAAAARGATVDGIDFAATMIAALEARAAREGVTAVRAQVGDGMALPFVDASFDVGYSMFGLMFFPDRAQGLRELHRVLVPGGRVAISSWQPMSRIAIYVELFGALGELLPNLPLGGGSPPLGQPEEAIAELSAAGFVDVEVHELAHAMDYPSLDAFWASVEKSLAPLVLIRARLGEEAYAPVGRGVLERLRARFGDGPVSLTMYANLGVARR